MAVTIKSEHEIALMRESCKRLAVVHDEIGKMIRPGISTWELDKKAYELIKELGGTPNFLHLYGYPATICASVNEVVVHGIPSKEKILKEGDIVGIDMGLIYKGYHSDAARTHGVGEISEEDRKLIEVTKQSFFEGIRFARAGCHLYEISAAIQKYAESFGYGVVRDMVGHGIGTKLHEDPEVPNYKRMGSGKGILLRPGMTLAVEPMINQGTWRIRILDDEWTAVTEDGKKSAHYENTLVITEGEPEILTLYRDGREV
ncbi:MAG: type I methionyl aminopeptidase [Lachnospiraceae bacterium]|jgi:methionyl aminopeptidase|nr:type I methionyl aminopeptidase [Lachnospiraceae bacterium]MBQ6542364.1 type I methionyl aminopeptidase [Lachnospiraceae bacterium]MBQ7601541.1 type I methionyl aminopeptidase [Lachnospiraceae bacterium]MBR5339641.1 type I methionyl aminopeptidase [Lachnospiraceae bacterium]